METCTWLCSMTLPLQETSVILFPFQAFKTKMYEFTVLHCTADIKQISVFCLCHKNICI